jgi:16S rRNA (guanine1207-N2)-methyltransferase
MVQWGLFAAKFWPDQEVDMVDVNERALRFSQKKCTSLIN